MADLTNPSEMLDALMELRDLQLAKWPMAEGNYDALGKCERRSFRFGNSEGYVQFNPAREVSTGARIDKSSIAGRPCFLCEKNRPHEQIAEELLPGWVILINPFPILPLHFTIASSRHIPQDKIPLEMASMAERLPGMAIFFNGAKAGASAPDHLHCQAVMKNELPLLRMLENGVPVDDIPFKVVYKIITPDISGLIALNEIVKVTGKDRITGKDDPNLVNAFAWIGDDFLLRMAIVCRSAHRPECYLSDDNPEGMMVSPGAIDMAGIIVLPRRCDYDRISQNDINKIFSDVAVGNN